MRSAHPAGFNFYCLPKSHSCFDLRYPRLFQRSQPRKPLPGVLTDQRLPTCIILLELWLPVINRDESPPAAREDMHIGIDLPSAVEGADADVRDMRTPVCVIVPKRRVAGGAAGNRLTNAGFRGDADKLWLRVGRWGFWGGSGVAGEDGQQACRERCWIGVGGRDGRRGRGQSNQRCGLYDGINCKGRASLALAGCAVAAMNENGRLRKLEPGEAAAAAAGQGEEVFLLGVMNHDWEISRCL